jgi:hypothetical protein|tara:strand:- start:2990 stop:3226 length:237 start_codon:yes stop_codon:yes gene_type:complete
MDGLIRKIVIGKDPKNAMAYYVGMRAGGGNVSTIILDDRHLFKYGKNRYLVYIDIDESQVLWKGVDEMPCIVEYDLNF